MLTELPKDFWQQKPVLTYAENKPKSNNELIEWHTLNINWAVDRIYWLNNFMDKSTFAYICHWNALLGTITFHMEQLRVKRDR